MEGMERGVAITMWDWEKPTRHPHDDISTDKRNPTVNANGLLYAGDYNETIAGGRGVGVYVTHCIFETEDSCLLPMICYE
jgi:hypothetical protein